MEWYEVVATVVAAFSFGAVTAIAALPFRPEDWWE